MSVLLERERFRPRSLVMLALILSAATGVGLLAWNGPLALLLLAGGACVAAICLFLVRRPLTALHVALFLYLIPFGLWLPEVDLLQTIGINGAIALAFCAWLLRASFQRRPIVWNSVCLLIGLYIVWATVSLLWAPDLVEGRKRLVGYGLGLIILFLIVQQVRTLEAIDGMMRVLAMVGWIVVIAGLLTLLLSDFEFGARLKIFNMNENALGYYLTSTLPGTMWPALRSSGLRRGVHIAFSVLFVLCTLILVLASGSRGSALSVVIVLVAFWFWKPLRPWGMAGTVLVVGMLASAPFLLDSLDNRRNENWGNELGARDEMWKASLQLIKDYPLTGLGVGNGRYGLQRYIGSLTSAFDHRDDLPSHNPLLEVGVDTGLFGMFLYLCIHVAAFWQFFSHRSRGYMREGALAAYVPMALAVAGGYFASFIKDGGMENHPTLFLLLALLIIPSQLSHDSDPKPVERPIDTPLAGCATRAPEYKPPGFASTGCG